MKNKHKYRFEYRYETALSSQIQHVSLQQDISRNRLMSNALNEAMEYFSCGMLHYRERSDFLNREKTNDKHRYEMSLNEKEREFLRKLAFTWRVSQAEVMRVVVEYYVYSLYGQDLEKREVYAEKVRYTQPVPAPMLVVYDIVNTIEEKYHMYHPPKLWNLKFV